MTDMIRELRGADRRLGMTEAIERPFLYLPWSQRVLNPFPLASSGGQWGDMVQPWPILPISFNIAVFVVTTNNGTNFWTLDLTSDDGATVMATVNTSAVAANGWRRLSTTTITTPATTNVVLSIRPTATLTPGVIYIAPSLALFRTG